MIHTIKPQVFKVAITEQRWDPEKQRYEDHSPRREYEQTFAFLDVPGIVVALNTVHSKEPEFVTFTTSEDAS